MLLTGAVGFLVLGATATAVLLSVTHPDGVGPGDRKSRVTRYVETISIPGYRMTRLSVRNDIGDLRTYWLGPVGANLPDAVTAANLQWQEHQAGVGKGGESRGYVYLGFGIGADIDGVYCDLFAERAYPPFWTTESRALPADTWGLTDTESAAVSSGQFDVLVINAHCRTP